MRVFSLAAALALLLQQGFAASEDPEEKPEKPRNPCTIRSPTTGSYFDLTPLNVTIPIPDETKEDEDPVTSWHVRGHDYGANFTLNICAPAVETLKNVVGVDEKKWHNVSAFYVMNGKNYSIGSTNDELVIRGRKLVLNYTDGSPCEDEHSHRMRQMAQLHSGPKHASFPRKLTTGDDLPIRRKSTIISLLCEKDPLAPKVAASFVGASPDQCAYFFELRSSAACPSVEVAEEQLGPGGVFGVIAFIAILVYIAGGCMYQRAVQNQRGWRQLPNYALWASIASFCRDVVVVLGSSCLRLIPRASRRYAYTNGVSSSSGMNGSLRREHGGSSEDDNRLIDQLDEVWDD